MAYFKDETGDRWELSITITAVKHVRDATDNRINLAHPEKQVDGQPQHVLLLTDIVEFWEVLTLLCEGQFAAKNIDAEEFGRRMAGDCIMAAQDVFWREWRAFFQTIRRPEVALALEKMWSLTQQAKTKVATMLKLVPTTDHETMQKLNAALTSAFGISPESLESSQENTPGENSTDWPEAEPSMIA